MLVLGEEPTIAECVGFGEGTIEVGHSELFYTLIALQALPSRPIEALVICGNTAGSARSQSTSASKGISK